MPTMFDYYMIVIELGNKYRGSLLEGKPWKFGFQRTVDVFTPEELATFEPNRSNCFGLVVPVVVMSFRANAKISQYFVFDDEAKTMLLRREHHDPVAFLLAMIRIRTALRDLDGKPFGNLKSSHLNHYPLVGGPSPKHCVPRDIAGLLGVVTSSVHVNVYSRTKAGDVFVMVRNTEYRQMLPATNKIGPCFGGAVLITDKSPLDALVRMVLAETGSGQTAKAMKGAQAAGKISYCDIQPLVPGVVNVDRPEFGLRHVFDLEVAANWWPKFKHGAVPAQTIESLSVHQVKTALLDGDFPETAGLAMLDFLVRHRLLGMSEEKMAVLEENLHPPLDM